MTKFGVAALLAVSMLATSGAAQDVTVSLTAAEVEAVQTLQDAGDELVTLARSNIASNRPLPTIGDLPEGQFAAAFDVDIAEIFADHEVGLITTLCSFGQSLATAYLSGRLSSDAVSSTDPQIKAAVAQAYSDHLSRYHAEVALAARFDMRCSALTIRGFNELLESLSAEEAVDMAESAEDIRHGFWRLLDTAIIIATSSNLPPSDKEIILLEVIRQIQYFAASLSSEQRGLLIDLIAGSVQVRELSQSERAHLGTIRDALSTEECNALCRA